MSIHWGCFSFRFCFSSLELLTIRYFFSIYDSLKMLPAMAFENLNSLESLSIQNNKLVRIPEDIMETLMDTLRVVEIQGIIKLLSYNMIYYL